jgi:hypothetical protein
MLRSEPPTSEHSDLLALSGVSKLHGRIENEGMMLFHGKIDKLNFGEKLMIRAIGAPTGDFRDWDANTAWASARLYPFGRLTRSGSTCQDTSCHHSQAGLAQSSSGAKNTHKEHHQTTSNNIKT